MLIVRISPVIAGPVKLAIHKLYQISKRLHKEKKVSFFAKNESFMCLKGVINVHALSYLNLKRK